MEELSKKLHSLLYGSGRTLSTAESCTGGGIAAAIVATSGSSNYFKGGVVSYCNEIKERVLGVSHQTLEEKTAVCEDVARQMCEGVMNVMDSDYAISITGAAGPTGGTPEIPVGTIWIGYGAKGDIRTYRICEDHGRTENLQNATKKALSLMIDYLKD